MSYKLNTNQVPRHQYCYHWQLITFHCSTCVRSGINMAHQATPSSQKALMMELKSLQEQPLEGFRITLVTESDLYNWQVAIFGPPNTLYEGGYFKVSSQKSNWPIKETFTVGTGLVSIHSILALWIFFILFFLPSYKKRSHWYVFKWIVIDSSC